MHTTEEELKLYILERLPRRQDAALTHHLKTCAECQGKLKDAVRLATEAAKPISRTNRVSRPILTLPVGKPITLRLLSPASSGRSTARILDVAGDGLKLRVTEFLHPGSTIQINTDDTIVIGEVRYCRPAGAGFQTGIRIHDSFRAPVSHPFESKRRELRNNVLIRAQLRIEGFARVHLIKVLDVSRTGLRIRFEMPLPAGTAVQILYRGAAVSGQVRYARELGPDEFNIGINAESMTVLGQTITDAMDLALLFSDASPTHAGDGAAEMHARRVGEDRGGSVPSNGLHLHANPGAKPANFGQTIGITKTAGLP